MRGPLLYCCALLVACGGKDTPVTPNPGTAVIPNSGSGGSGGAPTGLVGGTPGATPGGTVKKPPATDYCPAWPAATGSVIGAAPTDKQTLQATLDGLSTGDTLELAAGTWNLTAPLTLTVPGITIRSATGNPADVVLDGDQTATSIFEVLANDISIVSITITDAYEDGVRIIPQGADLSGLTLYDVDLVDNAQYGVQIDTDANQFHADGGTVACSRLILTDTGRANVRNGCLTAGVEARRAQDWTITDSHVEGYWCNISPAVGGIRFWRGSRNTRIIRSVVLDSHRGIQLGFGDDSIVRSYADQPCGGIFAQHYGGAIHNTAVYANDPDLYASIPVVAHGISLEAACEVEVLHNTVHHPQDPSSASIAHRFDRTSGLVANSLVSHTIRRLDGSTATAAPNSENAQDNTWVHVPSGDFRLAPNATAPVDACDVGYAKLVPEDFEGHSRTKSPDCGLDERL